MNTRLPAWAFVARVLLGVFFLWAAVVKMLHPTAFALAVSRYPMMAGSLQFLIQPVAIVLPWMEALAALAVLFAPGRLRAGGALLMAAMLVVFTIAIAAMLAGGQASSCGCFSVRADAASSNAWNIVRNVLMFAGAILVVADAHREENPLTQLRTKFRIPLS